MNFYQICAFFCIYAFAGWCCEVVYAALVLGKFVNRGFLNGPVCPIYGFGMLLVISVLTPIQGRLLTLFVGSFVLTSAIEFVGGFLLEKIFRQKWWDYTNEHFNIMGYVCLKFSLIWGLACTFVMKLVHPMIATLVAVIPRFIGWTVIIVIAVLFACDISVTVMTIAKMKKRVKLIDSISAELKKASDKIGSGLFEGTVKGEQKANELKERSADETEKLKAKLDESKKRLEGLKTEKIFGYDRLSKAFPTLDKKFDLTGKKNAIIDMFKKSDK